MKKKAKRRRSLILSFFLLVIIIYSVVSLIGQQIEINQYTQQLGALNTSIEEQQLNNDEMKRLLEEGNEKQLMERIARENGYVKPGDRVYYDISSGS